MTDEHTPTQNEQDDQHDDLELQDDQADDVKGGSWHGGIKKQPEGFRKPETFHGG